MVPTVLEALGLQPPTTLRGAAQSPIEGVSFAHTFDEAEAATKHVTQYYEALGHRSIYHDGWKAVCPWPGPSFAEAAQKGRRWGDEITSEALDDLEENAWELYHVAEDFAESKNVAGLYPSKLREMISLWWTEAGKYNVLPLDGRGTQRFSTPRPQVTAQRERYVYYAGGGMVPTGVAANVKNRPHSITADVILPEGGAEGVLLAHGARFGGYALYVKDRRLHYVHNYVGREEYRVSSGEELPAGKLRLRFEFEVTSPADIRNGRGAGGWGHLYVNGKPVGSAEIPVTCPIVYALAGEGLTCGNDGGQEVTADYEAPFAFGGTIKRVTVDVSGWLMVDGEAEQRVQMARQ
jgi:arylsulfatase